MLKRLSLQTCSDEDYEYVRFTTVNDFYRQRGREEEWCSHDPWAKSERTFLVVTHITHELSTIKFLRKDLVALFSGTRYR